MKYFLLILLASISAIEAATTQGVSYYPSTTTVVQTNLTQTFRNVYVDSGSNTNNITLDPSNGVISKYHNGTNTFTINQDSGYTGSGSLFLSDDGNYHIVGGNPGGLNLQLQFNDLASFGGASGIVTDSTHTNLTVSGAIRGASFTGTGTTADSVVLTPNDAGTFYFGFKAYDTASSNTVIVGPSGGFTGIPYLNPVAVSGTNYWYITNSIPSITVGTGGVITAGGVASSATDSAVTIATTGWTNTFGKNATVYMDGTNLVYTVYNNALTAVYTNGVAAANATVNLQISGKIIITAGGLNTGRAVPF